LADLKAAAF